MWLFKVWAICKTAGIGAACPMGGDRRVGSRPNTRCGGEDDRCKSEAGQGKGKGKGSTSAADGGRT